MGVIVLRCVNGVTVFLHYGVTVFECYSVTILRCLCVTVLQYYGVWALQCYSLMSEPVEKLAFWFSIRHVIFFSFSFSFERKVQKVKS